MKKSIRLLFALVLVIIFVVFVLVVSCDNNELVKIDEIKEKNEL